MRNLNKKIILNLSSIISHLSSPSGFTILELLVAFSLIAVVTGVGFVSFVSYSRKQILVQAASDLKQAVDLARFNALSNVKPAACGSTDQLLSYTVNFCINNNPSCDPGLNGIGYQIHASCGAQKPLVLSKKLPQNVTFTVAGATLCQNVVFNSVNPVVSGGPCDVKISGYSNFITFSIDSQGYAF